MTMIIDSNVYLGSWPYWNLRAKIPKQLVDLLDECGIQKALVSSLRSIFLDTRKGNEEVWRACEKYGDRLVGIPALAPHNINGDSEAIRGLKDGLFKGIRIYPFYHGFDVRESEEIFRVAEEFKVPVILPHQVVLNFSLPSFPLPEIAFIIERYPQISFVVSCINYALAELMRPSILKFRNLYVETSGLQASSSMKLLIEELGVERILFGTGLPVQYPMCNIEKVNNLEISDKGKEMIMGVNASRLFRLDE